MSEPVCCEPISVWITVARSKKRRLPCSCLPDDRGTLSVVASSRFASTTDRFRERAGSTSIRSRNTAFSTTKSEANSGERTVALRGEPVSRASSPITSPLPR